MMATIEDYVEAHHRYQGFRDAAFHVAWDFLHKIYQKNDLHLWPIDDRAIAYWAALHETNNVNPDSWFSWDSLFTFYRRRPKRFDIAIWDGRNLCGMAIGEPSKSKAFITLKWMERFPTGRSLPDHAVSHIVTVAASEYGKVLGSQYLKIKNPLPDTEELYSNLEFSLADKVGGVQYLSKKIL